MASDQSMSPHQHAVDDWRLHNSESAPPAAPAPMNQELLAALRALYVAAPTSTDCNAFHHSAAERHGLGDRCKPAQDYLAALEQAGAAIANAVRAESGAPAPAPQPLTPFTDAQVHRLWANASLRDAPSFEAFKRMVRLTESAHGITGGATGGSK